MVIGPYLRLSVACVLGLLSNPKLREVLNKGELLGPKRTWFLTEPGKPLQPDGGSLDILSFSGTEET